MTGGPSPLDRSAILAAVMPSLLRIRPGDDDDGVGVGWIVAVTCGVCAGIPVATEVFGRLGVRVRPRVPDGSPVTSGEPVADVGGPLGSMRAAGPLAIAFLERLSTVASGVRLPDPADPLEMYAARLSSDGPVRDDGPTFRLELEGSP
jgi:Quinolinate phosphoribosyl transferase, N-terminal domain